MANINKRYPEYPITPSFETENNTVVPTSVTPHTNIDKVNLFFDTYKGQGGNGIRRVGSLFKINGTVFAEFTIDNTNYVIDVTLGTVEEAKHFNKIVKDTRFTPAQVKAIQETRKKSQVETLKLMKKYLGKNDYMDKKLAEYNKCIKDERIAFSVYADIIKHFKLDSVI